MAKDRSFMLLIEPYEARLLLESLIKTREEFEAYGRPVHEIDYLMSNIITHAGIPWTKRAVPEAYAICFP